MLLSKSQTACQRSNSISNTITNTNIKPPVQLRTQQASTGSAKRRDLLASLVSGAGVTALLLTPKDASAATDFLSSMNSSSNSGGGGLTIAPLNTAAKKAMDERDSAMEYQCKGGNGGMFDCEGDRRQFAKNQYAEWLKAGGVPKRIREGRPQGPRAF